MKQWFKTLESKQTKTVVPERQETKEVSSAVAPAYCLENVSWSQCGEVELGEIE